MPKFLEKPGYIIIVDQKAYADENGNLLSFKTKEQAERYIKENNINGTVK